MSNVIQITFPKQSKRVLPRRRVFYLGQYYSGPPLCQSLEKLWIKRKPNNRWVFQEKIYGRVHEQEEYDGDDLLEVIDSIPFVDEMTVYDSLDLGWDHHGETVQF